MLVKQIDPWNENHVWIFMIWILIIEVAYGQRNVGIICKAMRSKYRGDIKNVDAKVQVNDLLITHTNINRESRAAILAGAAAEETYLRKVKFYNNKFESPMGHLEPLGIEIGGRWHSKMKKIMYIYF